MIRREGNKQRRFSCLSFFGGGKKLPLATGIGVVDSCDGELQRVGGKDGSYKCNLERKSRW